MAKIIEDVGVTTPPEGADPFRVWITDKKLEPIEVVSGCTDFRLCPDEAMQLAALLRKAARSLGAKEK